jgi:hypothetical protein
MSGKRQPGTLGGNAGVEPIDTGTSPGIVRPGVDGDVAGLLSRTDAFEQNVLAAVESDTLRAGFEWAQLSEEAFELRLSRPGTPRGAGPTK